MSGGKYPSFGEREPYDWTSQEQDDDEEIAMSEPVSLDELFTIMTKPNIAPDFTHMHKGRIEALVTELELLQKEVDHLRTLVIYYESYDGDNE